MNWTVLVCLLCIVGIGALLSKIQEDRKKATEKRKKELKRSMNLFDSCYKADISDNVTEQDAVAKYYAWENGKEVEKDVEAELDARERSQSRFDSNDSDREHSTDGRVNLDSENIKLYDTKEMTNKELLVVTLRDLGCQPTSEEDGSVSFGFQGERFNATPNGNFMRIWDLPYLTINVLDTRLPIMMEAINKVNYLFGPVVVLGSPDENGERVIASRYDILFTSDIPKPEMYIESILMAFFNSKHELIKEFEELTGNTGSPQPSTLSSGSPFQN